MNADEFVTFITPYLPIQYKRKTSNYYQQYLLENLTLSWNDKKYQFTLLTANILFMTVVFKDFWFDDKISQNSIVLDKQLPISYYNNAIDFFGLSKYNEKIFLRSYLKSLDFDDNEIKDVLHLIDYRDHCAHASGKIYYNADKVGGFLNEYARVIEEITLRRETDSCKKIKEFYDLHISSVQGIKYFIEKLIFEYNLSYKECFAVKGMFEKQNSIDCLDKVYLLLLKYYLNVVIENYYYDEDNEKKFRADLESIIKLNVDKKSEIADIVEKDLGFVALEGYGIIPYDEIKAIFDSESTQNTNEIDLDSFHNLVDGKSIEELKTMMVLLENEIGGKD